MQHADAYRLKRMLIFLALLTLFMTPIYLWVVAYMRANYAPYDPQAIYLYTFVRFGNGNAYMAELTPTFRVGDPDTSEYPRRSELLLYEDGVLLGPAHTAHDQIDTLGHGRYSHWFTSKTIVMFSASDNSDPRANGRVYRIVDPSVSASARRH
jgi:hypothetical protein